MLLLGLLVACAAAAPPRPYADGRLLQPAYVEVVGKASEILGIKQYGLSQGWAVDCEGSAGDEATLRLRFPAGTSQEAIESYFGGVAFLTQPRGRKVQMIYHGMERSKGCITLP